MDGAGAVQRSTPRFQEPARSLLGVRMLGVLLWRWATSLQARLSCRCPAPSGRISGIMLIVTPHVVDLCRLRLVQSGMSAVLQPA